MDVSTISRNVHSLSVPFEGERTPTPALFGNHLYTSGVPSRVLEWVYSIFRVFGWKTYRQERLNDITQRTHEAIVNKMEEVKAFAKRYQAALLSLSKGVEVSDLEVAESKRKIVEWNTWVYPVIKEQIWPQMQSFTERMKDLYHLDMQKFWVDNDVEIRRIKRLQRAIRLEEICESAMPLPALYALAVKRGEFSDEHRLQLRRWIDRCNEQSASGRVVGKKLTVREFHRGLSVLCELWSQNQDNLSYMEYMLKEGFQNQDGSGFSCHLFDQEDPKYLDWINRIIQKGRISYLEGADKKECVLGGEVERSSDDLETRLFRDGEEVNNGRFIAFGKNEAWLGIQERRGIQKESNIAEAPLPIKNLGIYRKFVFQERLDNVVGRYQWKSEDSIHQEDRRVADAIAEMIQVMVEQNYTPKELSSDTLAFQLVNKGEVLLRSTVPYHRDRFCYLELDKFLHDLNLPKVVHAHVMTSSGLTGVKDYKFLATRVSHWIVVDKKKRFTADRLKRKYKVPSHVGQTKNPTVEHLKPLTKKVEAIMREVYRRIKERHTVSDKLEEKELEVEVWQTCSDGKWAAYLPDNFVDKVMERLVKKKVIVLKKELVS